MRLINRNRAAPRREAPRIVISQAEIRADLDYPAGRRPASPAAAPKRTRR